MKRISVEEFPSISHCAQSLALYRELDDKAGMANSLEYLGWVEFSSAHSAPAQARFEESLTLRRAFDDKQGIANSLSALGYVADSWGEQAATLFEESLALSRALNDQSGIAYALNNLGSIALKQGDYVTARRRLEESLARNRPLGDKVCTAASLEWLGMVDYYQGDGCIAHEVSTSAARRRLRSVGEKTGCQMQRRLISKYSSPLLRARPRLLILASADTAPPVSSTLPTPALPGRAKPSVRRMQARPETPRSAPPAAW